MLIYCRSQFTSMAQLMVHGEHKTNWVTISEDEYESMKMTIEVLQDSNLMSQLLESKKDVAAGRVYPAGEVKRRLLG